jgi:hypothetical protein
VFVIGNYPSPGTTAYATEHWVLYDNYGAPNDGGATANLRKLDAQNNPGDNAFTDVTTFAAFVTAVQAECAALGRSVGHYVVSACSYKSSFP